MGFPSANKVILGVGVKNTGSMNSGSFSCEVRQGNINGSLLFSTTFDNVPAGQTVNTQFEWDVSTLIGGIYDIVVVADPSNVVTESQENDNWISGQVAVLPDLLIEPSSAEVSGTTASVTIRNVGAKPSIPSKVRVSMNDLPIGELAIPALNPGDSIDVNIPLSVTIKFGRFVITVSPDASGEDEVTLNNNTEIITRFAPGDFNLDGDVDISDLIVLAAQWLGQPGLPSADITPEPLDQFVDIRDFALFAEYWLTHYGQ
jgi:subtilase family serine protease